jgi:hypothetical protein
MMIVKTTRAKAMRTGRNHLSNDRASGDLMAVTIIPAPNRYNAAPANNGQGTAKGPENGGANDADANNALPTQTPNPRRARTEGSTHQS